MNKLPPHLPSPSCRVDTHNKLRSLRWLIFIILLAFLSGMSAALVAVGWFIPTFVPSQSFYANGLDNRNTSLTVPDSLLVRQTRQRLVTIFDKLKKTDKMFYPDEAWVAQAAFISSDGWAVTFVPSYSKGQEKYWEAVDYQGISHKIEMAIYDSVSNFLYLKIEGQGFRVMSFTDWQEVKTGSVFWSVGHKQWEQAMVDEFVLIGAKKSFAIWRPQYYYSLVPEIERAILIDNQGSLVGFVNEDNNLLPIWLIKNQVTSLLSNQLLSYQGLSWSGYLVSGATTEEGNWQSLLGFYIIESPSRQTGVSVGRGDVILKINNQAIDEFHLAEQVLLAPEEFPVIVWREGEEVEIMVKKVEVGS